jgi:Ser-tRNA(Ala) deacylase AlaX
MRTLTTQLVPNNAYLDENGNTVFQFTNNHPSPIYLGGGGQPPDLVTLQIGNQDYDAKILKGSTSSLIEIATGSLVNHTLPDAIVVKIDGKARQHYSSLHSWGHAIASVGEEILGLKAVKGNHYPNKQAFVAFEMPSSGFDRDQYLEMFQCELDKLARNTPLISEQWIDGSKLSELESSKVLLPANFPVERYADQKVRLVKIDGLFATVCGGTHSAKLTKNDGFSLRKISKKSGLLKVSYDVAPPAPIIHPD